MHYILISSSLLLCASSLATDRIRPNFDDKSKDLTLFNGRSRNVGDSPNFVGHPVNRQRRSLWAMVMDHVAVAAEKFRMEPVLAEGVNNVEGFNNDFNSKLRSRSKSANVMLSEGGLDGEDAEDDEDDDDDDDDDDDEEPRKKVKSADDSKKLKDDRNVIQGIDVSDLKKSVEIVSKDAKLMREKYEKRKKYSKYLTEEKIDYLTKEFKKIIDTHEEAYEKERTVIYSLAAMDWEAMDVSDIAHLYMEGLSEARSEEIIHDILLKYPHGREDLVNGIAEVKEMREKFVEPCNKIQKQIDELGGLDYLKIKDNLNRLKTKFDEYKKYNERWLKHQTVSSFKK